MSERVEVTVTIPERSARNLAVFIDPDQGLDTLATVLAELADHAQQGVYRPGAWERGWITQVFGTEWLARVEPDTDDVAADGRVIFDRPRGQ